MMASSFRLLLAAVMSISILSALSWEVSAHAQSSSPVAANAQVTFYSNSVSLFGGMPGSKLAAFKGRIFEGDRQLTFLEPGHFVTFAVPSGPHEFSAAAWFSKHSSPGAHLTIDTQSGHRYFVECGVTTFGPVFVIREVDCSVAQTVGSRMKPLEPVHLRPDGKSLFVPQSSFPQCQ